MVPTLSGRMQTRLFLQVAVCLPWTLVAGVLLAPFVGGVGPALEAGTFVWATTGLAGLAVWEPLYHLLMQFRWDRDWPTPFLLAQIVPEGVLGWLFLTALGPHLAWGAYAALFTSTALITFAALQGPLRVVFLRWRFRGGRLL